MPYKPKHACKNRKCPNLTDHPSGYCAMHYKAHRKREDGARKTAPERGYDARWIKARKFYLKRHPFCELCWKEGKTVKAMVVHHKIDHKGNEVLFWDDTNWQALCRTCHNKITGKTSAWGKGRK